MKNKKILKVLDSALRRNDRSFRQSLIQLSLTIILALAVLPNIHAAQDDTEESPTQSGGKGSGAQLPEVIIKGGDRSGVRSEKPAMNIELNPDEAVLPATKVEEEYLNRDPQTLKDPSAGFSQISYNSRTVLPARIRLARDPVKVFYPLRDIMAVSPSLSQEIGTGWKLVVTDSDGHSFRVFKGGGLPPSAIPWNGRSERGEIVGVGKTYSPVITYKDTHGQSRNFVGESFTYDGVIHQESKGLVVSIAVGSLFEPKREFAETETINESGLDLLQEAADWIKRYFFTFPVRVEAYSADSNIAVTRAQAVSKILANLLLLPRGDMPANGTSSENTSERVDIIIANR